MNDRFKFRVWVEQEKRMVYFDLTHIIDGYIFDQEGDGVLTKWCLCGHDEIKPSEPMQSTGHRADKLIYEGDIVRVFTEFDFDKDDAPIAWTDVVVKENSGSLCMNVDIGEICLDYSLTTVGWALDEYSNYGYEYEVVGNIYENPDLLGEK